MDADLTSLAAAELEARAAALDAEMRPLQARLQELRGARDVLLTELRRRERMASATARRGLKDRMRAGELLTVTDLVADAERGDFDDYTYNLKTGGEVRLGFPLARSQTIAFTDGRQVAQARDLGQAGELYRAGWELGAPGKPGLRVHLAGTRTERVVAPEEVFARPAQ